MHNLRAVGSTLTPATQWDDVYITAPKIVLQKPLVEIVQELCKETEPKPIFCEIPEDLKLKTPNSGTQTSTITSSINSVASGYGASTTTTP